MGDRVARSRLVVPEGLLVDETVRERLERQLAAAPGAVNGIAAEIADLAPGASYRVHVEWAALETSWSAAAAGAPARAKPIRGAVLVRPNVDFAVLDGRVDIAHASVLVDPGAPVHDPARPIGPLEAASDRGRPPFPRRPLVVFLGCEPGSGSDWVRRLVNRLVRTDVEARIAAPEVASGVHLTRPCLPVEATIRALAPDVVVTLDALAASQVEAWCTGDRSTVVVAFDRALAAPMELVPWQIGRAAGRVRARIGPWVDVVAFAALVGRLCAGPHPVAPSDPPQLLETRAPVRERWTSATRPDAARGCVVVTGAIDERTSARVAGLADNLEGAGVPVTVATDASGAAREAELVLLVGVTPTPELDALIASRSRAGLPTLVDLGPHDVETSAAGTDARLKVPAAALVDACGFVVSPAGVLHDLAASAGRRVMMLPTLLTRSRAAALRDARTTLEPGAALPIGWRIEPGCVYADAIAEGIAIALEDRRNRVEFVGDPADVPTALRGSERLTVVSEDRLDPEKVARWAVHVWAPALIDGALVGDTRLLEEASCAGVASVMPTGAGPAVDGYVSPFVLVDTVQHPEEWANALHHVLDDADVRDLRAQEARRRADALDSAAASKAVVSRFAGWARYQRDRAEV